MENTKYSIGIIGLGYVGLPLVKLFIKKGCVVYGVDTDELKINSLIQHKSYLSDFTNEDIKELFQEGSFLPSTSFDVISHVDAILLCVPTPLDNEFNPDLQYVRSALQSILPFLKSQQIIILESSTYPGTTEDEICPIIQSKGFTIGEDIFVAFSPERIDPGQQQFQLHEIPKVVGGVTSKCTKLAEEIYQMIFENVVSVSSPKVAEMCKLVENSQRLVNISFMNELVMLADNMGIDLWEVIQAASTKPFGFTPYFPGPGIGGHCIPIDPLYLSWKARDYEFDLEFIKMAHQINETMPKFVVKKLVRLLNCESLEGVKILVIGVAYKKNINDVRESPALKIINLLLEKGANIQFYDPYISQIDINDKQLNSIELSSELLKQSHCTLILTDHTNIPYEKIVRESPLVFDTRNATKECKHLGNVMTL